MGAICSRPLPAWRIMAACMARSGHRFRSARLQYGWLAPPACRWSKDASSGGTIDLSALLQGHHLLRAEAAGNAWPQRVLRDW